MSDRSLFAQGDEARGGALGEGEVYARVAVERAIEGEAGEGLLYRGEGLRVGDRVQAPLGPRNKAAGGIVVAVGGEELLAGFDPRRVKRATGAGRARLPPPLVELARWIRSYYITPLGTVLAAMTPAAVKAGTGGRTRVCVQPTELVAGGAGEEDVEEEEEAFIHISTPLRRRQRCRLSRRRRRLRRRQ